MPNHSLYQGTVTHTRHSPFQHHLKYGVYNVCIDIDDLEGLDKQSKIFSVNKWNFLSFHQKQHGYKDGRPLRNWVDEHLSKNDIQPTEITKVLLFCFPRVLGYAFNPISVWYCYDQDNKVKAMIYEVRNTFKQWHTYFHKIEGDITTAHGNEKLFHVSPFFDVSGDYEFRTQPPGERYSLTILYKDIDGELLLTAKQTGIQKPFKTNELLKLFCLFPFMTAKVVWGIHWHAFKLWVKGAKYRPIPPKKETDISYHKGKI